MLNAASISFVSWCLIGKAGGEGWFYGLLFCFYFNWLFDLGVWFVVNGRNVDGEWWYSNDQMPSYIPLLLYMNYSKELGKRMKWFIQCSGVDWQYLSKMEVVQLSEYHKSKLLILTNMHAKMQETQVQFLGLEGPLEKEMASHSSVLVWRIPWTVQPSRLQAMGSQE